MITAMLSLIVLAVLGAPPPDVHQSPKINVAHRGASAYAPEHTNASYRLALELGADYVEQDLAITKDGVLICLHDPSLERTTNVEEVFPDRYTVTESTDDATNATRKTWLARDFTLAEIKQLDAGSWFDPRFRNERIPTFDEAVELVKGKAGLFPELKTPDDYHGRDVNFERLVADALDRHCLRGPSADPATPVLLQTFSKASAKKLAAMDVGVPVVLLFDDGDGWQSADKVKEWKPYVQGLGPAKAVVEANPDLVKWAHSAGMKVIPYTFRAANPEPYRDVRTEMEYFLYTLGVDGVFTDNPDQFPRR